MDGKFTGKQFAIQVGIQIVGSLIAGVILYQIFKPKEDDTTTAIKTAPTTKTVVVETIPEEEHV